VPLTAIYNQADTMKAQSRLFLCTLACCFTGAPSEAPPGRSVCQAGTEISAPACEWAHIVWVQGLEVVLQQRIGYGLAVTRDGGETWALIDGSAPTPNAPVFSASDAEWSLEDGELWRLGPFRGVWAKVISANPLADGLALALAVAADGTDAWIGGSVYREATEKEATSLERRFWRHDAPGKFEVLRAALCRTKDGGSSWEEVRLPVPGALEASDLHFAEGRLIAVTDRGLFESRNGGGAWRAVLPSAACVSRNFLGDFSGRYFIATGGGGVNGSPRWMLFTNRASSYLLAGAANQDHLCEVDEGGGNGLGRKGSRDTGRPDHHGPRRKIEA
jgi:hypothetical protein